MPSPILALRPKPMLRNIASVTAGLALTVANFSRA